MTVAEFLEKYHPKVERTVTDTILTFGVAGKVFTPHTLEAFVRDRRGLDTLHKTTIRQCLLDMQRMIDEALADWETLPDGRSD